MKKEVDNLDDELRSEYGFDNMKVGVKGNYVERYRAYANLVPFGPDIAEASLKNESDNIENPVRPHLIEDVLEAEYKEMAADPVQETSALEWSEAVIRDVADESL